MENKLFIISGHSGSGKSSLMKKIMSNEIVSYTTREKRVGEIEGSDYYFIDKENFLAMRDSGDFVEDVAYSGNLYGITKQEIESKLELGHAFVIVDYHGMKQLQKYYPNTVSIMLHTTVEDAAKQMLSRGDSYNSVQQRLKTYHEETGNAKFYDYKVINRHGEMDKTLKLLKEIIKAESTRELEVMERLSLYENRN